MTEYTAIVICRIASLGSVSKSIISVITSIARYIQQNTLLIF